MKQAGQVVLFRFPQTNLVDGKLRPALLLGKLPGKFNDWLICMISSQTRHYISGFDELIQEDDPDFESSGLKVASLIRTGRLAVVEEGILLGAIGKIDANRFQRIKSNLATWLTESQSPEPV